MTELIELVSEAQPLLETQDCSAWGLGDIAVRAVKECGVVIKPGRKKLDDDTPTLSDFAGMLNRSTQRVSEWYKCSSLYPPEVRPNNLRAFGDLSWGHYNLARKYGSNDLEIALDLLQVSVTLHMGYNAFKRWLKGEIWEGPLELDELPVKAQPYAKPEIVYWVTIAAMKE